MELPLKNFAVEYNHDDERWALTIKASSYSDALKRLQSIAHGSIVGESDDFVTVELPASDT